MSCPSSQCPLSRCPLSRCLLSKWQAISRLARPVWMTWCLLVCVLPACATVLQRPLTGPCVEPDPQVWLAKAAKSLVFAPFSPRGPIYDQHRRHAVPVHIGPVDPLAQAVISYPFPERFAGGDSGFIDLKRRSFVYDDALAVVWLTASGDLARALSADHGLLALFESALVAGAPAKSAASLLANDVLGELRARKLDAAPFGGAEIAELLALSVDGTLSTKLAKDVLSALLPRLSQRRQDAWLAEFRACDAVEHEKVVRPELFPEGPKLRMGEVVRAVSEKTGGDALVVTDVGQHQMIAARYSSFTRPRSSVTSGGLGTMGFALPAAIGAKLARPERTVVVFVGDGGFQMTAQELGTAAQARAAVKIVILDNEFLGMVRQWQELFFDGRYSETELKNPDFCRIAEAYGIPALRAETRSELASGIDTMLAHPGPFLLHVRVEREANVFPMVPAAASVSDVRLEA